MCVATQRPPPNPICDDWCEEKEPRARKEHHGERGGADERRATHVHLRGDQGERDHCNGARYDKSAKQRANLDLLSGIPPGNCRDRRELGEFARLKVGYSQVQPALGAADLLADSRNETKGQQHEGQAEPPWPRLLPEVIVEIRRDHRGKKTDTQPDELPFDEERRIAVAVLGEGCSARKHHASDHDKDRYCRDKKVDALAVHSVWLARSPRGEKGTLFFGGNLQRLPNLDLGRIGDLVVGD
jgi:hypothetical protein